jgi:phage terminase large subunit-like protein
MTDDKALIPRLLALTPEQRNQALFALGESRAREFDGDWPSWAHRGQTPAHDDWHVWVMLAGRGFGKTRAGAEWVSGKARAHPEAKIALVAATPEEARRVMIEGRAGLLAVAADGDERRRLAWEPGLGRLTFASGATAFVFSGADGESLRGAEHHYAWCDELAKWKRGQATWDNLLLGLRAGEKPQAVVTTTPKPLPLLRSILAMPDVVLTGGATWRNPHLPPAFVDMIEGLHAGTRLGRQELDGVLLEDVEGALFPRALLEKCRVPAIAMGTGTSSCPRSSLVRIVIGVDPPATAAGDACGIVVCGLDAAGCGYVLADLSVQGLSPEQWARKVAAAAEAWRADRIVAEGNQGGEMVTAVLRGAGLRLPVTRVHARAGKAARAEPIAAFFESGEAKLAGRFPDLEDELAGLSLGGLYQGPGRSPDRADAMVWALTALLLRPRAEPGVRGL